MKRLGSFLAIAALIATACSSSSSSSPAAQSTAVQGGSMVYALNGDMVLADPALVSDGNSLFVEAQVVQGLLGLQPGTISTVIPVLAAALPTVSSDGLTYTFKLRTGIKFHDGTDFNADAVVYNYNRWQNFPAGDLQTDDNYYAQVFGGFGSASNIASVTAPDEQTAVITLKTPQSNFELASTLAVFGIESPAALKAGNADQTPISSNKYAQGSLPQGQDMVGTGPFIFKEWVPGDHVTIVKNPNYWDAANAAHLDQVTFKPFGDSTATLQAIQSGGVDAAFSISPLDVKTATELRAHDHRPRRVLQPAEPGHEPERRRHGDDLRQRESPPGHLRGPEQAELRGRVLLGPGQGADGLHAAGHPRLQGRDPARLQRRPGQGRPGRVGRDRIRAQHRPLLPLQRRPALHA